MAFHLKAARVNAGFTQTDAVYELNKKGVKISRNTLRSYEQYKTKPDIETAKTMAALYNLSVDDIIFFSNDCA